MLELAGMFLPLFVFMLSPVLVPVAVEVVGRVRDMRKANSRNGVGARGPVESTVEK